MTARTVPSLLLVLCACTALSACETTQTAQNPLQTNADEAVIERAAYYARDTRKSESYLEQSYKKAPDSEEAAVDYAAALRRDGKLDEAGVILEPFAKEKVASSLVTSEYAAVLLAQGDHAAAEKYAQKAIVADDANFKAYHRLGIALDAQNEHEKAERAYRKGLEIWQGDPTTIMNNLALNLASQGYLDEAAEILRKAQDISPDRIEIERNIRIVTALQQADGVPAPKPPKKPEQ